MKNVLQATPLNGGAIARWWTAWNHGAFRTKLVLGFALTYVMFHALPAFFNFVEGRPGYDVHDTVLRWLPPVDTSNEIFLLLWGSALLTTVRALQEPSIPLVFIWSYLFMSLARVCTITLTPLNTPPGLIPLVDPLSNHFYPGRFITKDLFFSGHTGTLCLMWLCMRRPIDRIVVGIAAIVLGILLLVQHVHYSFDILGAPVFAFASYRFAKWFVQDKSL